MKYIIHVLARPCICIHSMYEMSVVDKGDVKHIHPHGPTEEALVFATTL